VDSNEHFIASGSEIHSKAMEEHDNKKRTAATSSIISTAAIIKQKRTNDNEELPSIIDKWHPIIDSITQDMSRKAFNSRLKTL
jgi:hypothetical protein